MNRKKVTIVSWKVFASLSGLIQTDVAVVTAVFVPPPRLRGMSAWLTNRPGDIWINSLSDFMFTVSIAHVSRTPAWLTIWAGKWTMELKS